MKAVIILAVICGLLTLGLIYCILSIHQLCGAIQAILDITKCHSKMLGLEE